MTGDENEKLMIWNCKRNDYEQCKKDDNMCQIKKSWLITINLQMFTSKNRKKTISII